MEHTIELGVIIVSSLLGVAVLSSILLQKIRFPYTIGLVIIGGTWAALAQNMDIFSSVRDLALSPDIILFLILPTLIFDAAININIKLLFRNIIPILLLAVVGILISAGIVGFSLPFMTPLALGGALLFGALISATDPVAVIALFNEVKAPKRLLTLIDGESIFNDATAIVLFTIFLGNPIHNYADITHNLIPGLISFIIVLCGGIIVGGVVGVLGSLMLQLKKGDMILQFTVTLITAYVSFVLADKLEMSGVISTLAAGLVFSATSDITIRRRHRDSLHHFWEYFAFTANSFVFLLLGFTEVSIFHTSESIRHSFWYILIAVPIVVIARIAVIYIIVPIYNKFTDNGNKISPAYQAILVWGGLRGAVPIALVFSIPVSQPNRIILLHLTFGFILFTLLIQGTTIKRLMNLLGIHPETSELEGVEGLIESTHSFSNEHLANLVIKRLVDIFSEEGFFISKDETGIDSVSFIIKKKDIIIIISQKGVDITFTTKAENSNYVNTVLFETILEFDNSLQAIKELVKPEHLSKLIRHTVKQEDEKTEVNEKTKSGLPGLDKFITEDGIVKEIQGSTKEQIIKELLDVMKGKGVIPDYDLALKSLLAREKTMTTGIGEGIALPHAKIPGINKIVAVMGIRKDGVDFDSMDKKPTNIVVLILSPASDPVPHIQFLASITKLLSNSARKQEIIDSSPLEICRILKNGV